MRPGPVQRAWRFARAVIRAEREAEQRQLLAWHREVAADRATMLRRVVRTLPGEVIRRFLERQQAQEAWAAAEPCVRPAGPQQARRQRRRADLIGRLAACREGLWPSGTDGGLSVDRFLRWLTRSLDAEHRVLRQVRAARGLRSQGPVAVPRTWSAVAADAPASAGAASGRRRPSGVESAR